MGADRFKRDQTLNRMFEAQSYACEAFVGTAFVQENQTILRHLIRLLTIVPGADFNTFLELLDPDTIPGFQEFIAQLETPSSQEFFSDTIFTREFRRRTSHLRARLSQLKESPEFQHATSSNGTDPRRAADNWSDNFVIVNLSAAEDTAMGMSTLRRIALAKAVELSPALDTGVRRQRMIVADNFFEFFGADFVEFSRLMRELKRDSAELVLAHRSAEEATRDIREQIATKFSAKLIAATNPSSCEMLRRTLGIDDSVLRELTSDTPDQEFLFANGDGDFRRYRLPWAATQIDESELL